MHELNRRGLSRIVVTDFLGEDEKWKNLLPLEFEDYVAADKFLEMVERDPGHYGKFTAVFHLGACSSTTVTDAEYVLKNNYACTKSLCKWSLARGARFVYASSAATYGDGSAGMDDRADDLRAFRPLNLYGYSKQLFDLYAWREGLLPRIVGIKYFNVFGPNEYHKGDMRSLVCKAFEQIRATAGPAILHQPAILCDTPPEALPSPGVGLRHDAPRARLLLVESPAGELAARLAEAAEGLAGERLGVMLPEGFPAPAEADVLFDWGRWNAPEELAQRLYSALRSLDQAGCTVILCPLPGPAGIGAALRDRLRKAAVPSGK